MAAPWVKASGEDLLIRVKVIPKARRDEVAGERGGRLLVRVTAAPEAGRANAAVCALLADRLDIAMSRLEVRSGASSREKTIRVHACSAEQALAALS